MKRNSLKNAIMENMLSAIIKNDLWTLSNRTEDIKWFKGAIQI